MTTAASRKKSEVVFVIPSFEQAFRYDHDVLKGAVVDHLASVVAAFAIASCGSAGNWNVGGTRTTEPPRPSNLYKPYHEITLDKSEYREVK